MCFVRNGLLIVSQSSSFDDIALRNTNRDKKKKSSYETVLTNDSEVFLGMQIRS